MPSTAEAVTFSGTVAGGGSETESYPLDGPATVEALEVRLYPGQELELGVDVLIKDKGSGSTRPIVQSGGSSTFRGDDDSFRFDLSKPVPDDSDIVVRAVNENPDFEYDFRVNMEVDYREGAASAGYSMLSGVLS